MGPRVGSTPSKAPFVARARDHEKKGTASSAPPRQRGVQGAHDDASGTRIASWRFMIDRVVNYLRGHGISFRLSSQPAPEAIPAVAFAVPPGGIAVETQVLLVGGRPAIACFPRGEQVSMPALVNELGAEVIAGNPSDLPAPFAAASGPIPPVGGALGALTIVDERVAQKGAIVFYAFSSCDWFEIPFDDFARVEQPKFAAFAVGGELPTGREVKKRANKAA
ncbi:Hypothetical protein A7982_10697 [Minicystis rosea]|nr:Hypothetical protein A7982_10697 [Minicystis rosea]